MKLWQDALLALACLAAIGCRADPNIVYLERENRELENTIYELQDCLDQYQRTLEACRQKNQALEAKLAGTAEAAPQSSRAPAKPDEPEEPAPAPGDTVPPTPVPKPMPDALRPPKIEIPEKALPEGQIPEVFKKRLKNPSGASNRPGSGGPATRFEGTSKTARGSAQQDRTAPTPADSGPSLLPPAGEGAGRAMSQSAQVASIAIRTEQTGGYNIDGRGGDDGIRTVIQPRDSGGHPCLAAGSISVVVLDPAMTGEAARVARWDFTPEEIAERISDNGIVLEMVWPQQPPSHGRLHLFVRYTTSDGRRLEADCPIEVALGLHRAEQWEPALLPNSVSDGGQQAAPRQDRPAAVGRATMSEPPSTAALPAPAAEQPAQLQAATERVPELRRPVWSPHRP